MFLQPTMGQIVRQRLSDGRKVSCICILNKIPYLISSDFKCKMMVKIKKRLIVILMHLR